MWCGPVPACFTPPFGALVGNNANPSSLRNWGHLDKAPWLSFHQIGNNPRTHDYYPYLTEGFDVKPLLPGINGEPYYDGMEDARTGQRKGRAVLPLRDVWQCSLGRSRRINPRRGEWLGAKTVTADVKGVVKLPPFRGVPRRARKSGRGLGGEADAHI